MVEALVVVGSTVSGFEFQGPESPQWPALSAAFRAGDYETAAQLEAEIWVRGDRPLEAMDPDVVRRVRDMDGIALPVPWGPPGEPDAEPGLRGCASVRLMGTRDGLEGARHGVELVARQAPGEVLPDPSEMRSGGSAKGVAAGRRQLGQHDPGVVVVADAIHQPRGDQAVDPPRQAAGRQEHPLRQVGHPEAPARCPCQPQQHVVRGQRQPVLRSQLGVELPGHLLVGVEEALPRAELARAEVCGHADQSNETCIAK
jgi:hypothetical protein